MKIVVAGIYRSGSTWLYNAVRLLMISEGYHTKGYFKGWGIDEAYDCHVIKTHAYYDDLANDADVVITSFRDYDDIRESMKKQEAKMHNEDFENATKWKELHTFMHWLFQWQMHSSYMMRYEEMIENPRSILVDLFIALDLYKADIDEVRKQLSELQAPKSGYDEITLLTETHP